MQTKNERRKSKAKSHNQNTERVYSARVATTGRSTWSGEARKSIQGRSRCRPTTVDIGARHSPGGDVLGQAKEAAPPPPAELLGVSVSPDGSCRNVWETHIGPRWEAFLSTSLKDRLERWRRWCQGHGSLYTRGNGQRILNVDLTDRILP